MRPNVVRLLEHGLIRESASSSDVPLEEFVANTPDNNLLLQIIFESPSLDADHPGTPSTTFSFVPGASVPQSDPRWVQTCPVQVISPRRHNTGF